MTGLRDHPERYALANELHARPFPAVAAPARAAYLALKPVAGADGRDKAADRAHLIALLDRFGAAHPQPDATHYWGRLGRFSLKWESHTEFVTYTLFDAGVADRPFDAATFAAFPEDWLAAAPGARITSALIRVEREADPEAIAARLGAWFVPESLAVARVLDGELTVASDFRIDEAGHVRIAVFAGPEAGERRTGRVVQRLCEIETYKTMSMLGFARARDLRPTMSRLEARLSALVTGMTGAGSDAEATLRDLLAISSELERMIGETSFRFGATGAYRELVNQRVAVLREERFGGRQTLAEFMMRRFDPAMRTVVSTQSLIESMSARATRAAELLRTQVDVERSAQNQKVRESMDRRADLQLRLQHTVEGLSVVAISYYAVGLALYLLGPFAEPLGIAKPWLAALVTPLVILGVWAMVRRIRLRMGRDE